MDDYSDLSFLLVSTHVERVCVDLSFYATGCFILNVYVRKIASADESRGDLRRY